MQRIGHPTGGILRRIGSLTVSCLLGLGVAPPGTMAAQESIHPVLAALEGRWEGEGTLMGRGATFTMTWSRVLNDRFLRLDFRNAFADPVQPVLEANAFYRVGSDTLTGQWMDTRGAILALHATLDGSTLVTNWTGHETGRTEYRVVDRDTVEVVDYVRSDGEYTRFATARYRRVR